MITRAEVNKVYPAPSLPDGQIVLGKPVKVKYDLSGSGYGFPFFIEFVLINQDSFGPYSQQRPFIPNKPIEFEVPPFRWFEVGDKVRVRARLWYIIQDPQEPYIGIVETPFSQTYDVVA